MYQAKNVRVHLTDRKMKLPHALSMCKTKYENETNQPPEIIQDSKITKKNAFFFNESLCKLSLK